MREPCEICGELTNWKSSEADGSGIVFICSDCRDMLNTERYEQEVANEVQQNRIS
jgi:ribosome-binding protein aMBF1 (putative translation factor)